MLIGVVDFVWQLTARILSLQDQFILSAQYFKAEKKFDKYFWDYLRQVRFTRGLYFIFIFQIVGISFKFGGIPLMLCGLFSRGLFSREVKSYTHMVY